MLQIHQWELKKKEGNLLRNLYLVHHVKFPVTVTCFGQHTVKKKVLFTKK
jgi:hypothetical protein